MDTSQTDKIGCQIYLQEDVMMKCLNESITERILFNYVFGEHILFVELVRFCGGDIQHTHVQDIFIGQNLYTTLFYQSFSVTLSKYETKHQ